MPGVVFLIVVPTANFERELFNSNLIFIYGICVYICLVAVELVLLLYSKHAWLLC